MKTTWGVAGAAICAVMLTGACSSDDDDGQNGQQSGPVNCTDVQSDYGSASECTETWRECSDQKTYEVKCVEATAGCDCSVNGEATNHFLNDYGYCDLDDIGETNERCGWNLAK